MNATELSDLLEVDSWYKLVTREEIATMLRQQQAEIEVLKEQLRFSYEDNEPVAWYNADDSSLSFKNHGGGWQPLYTHPAKTLTDEEIKDCYEAMEDEGFVDEPYAGIVAFAKAILRKAQEK